VDLKGFGRSPKPRDGRYAVADHAACVRELIEKLDLVDLTLIGHSFGGGVALWLASDAGLRTRLRSLVLIDTMAYRQRLPWFIALLRVPVIGPLAVAAVPERAQVRLVLRAGYADPARITADVVEAYAAPLRSADARRALIATAAALPRDDADALAARFGTIALPTLVLWGRRDRIVPLAIGERLHRAIAHSTLAVVDGAGHLPHEEAPERVLGQLCPFLAER
jgi:pimeloyl-ACP methyl ester carboxylesterase